jgi:hypothetical protein
MGRPIKSKYFGVPKGTGTGGEGVSLVTLGTNPESTLTVTVVFSAPDLPGGTTAAGTAVKTGNTVTSVTVDSAGSGYLTVPSVSFTGTSMSVIGSATATLTTSVSNVIRATAFLTGGSALVADIDEQVASKKYRVQTANGTDVARLVSTNTDQLVAGQMNILATDGNGSTYWVKKLTARRAVVVQSTASGSFVFNSGASVGWNLDAANSTDVLVDNH